MPIVKIDTTRQTSPTPPPVNTSAEPQTPFLTNEELKTSTLFNKDHDLDLITQYVKGMSWTVDYYYQIKNINDPSTPPDINTPATIQKYHKINNLILKLQSAINQDSFDNITGEATINCGFLPYVNDVFRATLMGGREAVFILTEVNIKTYNTNSVYDAQFKLLFLLDNNNAERYNDLIYKTMKEYVYDKDHLLDYGAPIILASDYTKKLNFKNIIPNVVDYYLKMFINKDKNLLALPTTSSVYIDSMLSEFLFKLITTEDSYLINKINRVDIDLSDHIGFTIWDVIVRRDLGLLNKAQSNIAFKYSPTIGTNALTRHASYLGISFIADSYDQNDPVSIPTVKNINKTPITPITSPLGNTQVKYVLTEAFYLNNKVSCGLLENLLFDYLEGNFINTDNLDILVNEYVYWDTQSQFYLIPILLVLLRDSVTKTYSSI
jgi:hypothetical protein